MRVIHSPHPETPETVICDIYSLSPKTHKLLQVHSQNPYLAPSIYRVHSQSPYLEPSIYNVYYTWSLALHMYTYIYIYVYSIFSESIPGSSI
jgi:hypothetical protein